MQVVPDCFESGVFSDGVRWVWEHVQEIRQVANFRLKLRIDVAQADVTVRRMASRSEQLISEFRNRHDNFNL